MKEKSRFVRVIHALILLVLLYLSNLFVGGFILKWMLESLKEVPKYLELVRMFLMVAPGVLSTALIYFIYVKIPFMKRISLPKELLKVYLGIQGLVMATLEPIAFMVSVMATDSPGSGAREMLIGYSFVWIPVNVVIWLVIVILLLFKKQINKLTGF